MNFLIISDDKFAKEGFKSLLYSHLKEIVKDVELLSGSDWLRFSRVNKKINLAVIDFNIDKRSFSEFFNQLQYQNVNILALLKNENSLVADKYNPFIKGYLLKNTTPSEFVNVVTALLDGHVFVPQIIADRIYQLNNSSSPENILSLTSREIEILKLIAKGKTNKAIAHTLYISKRTVDTHRQHLLKKFQVDNSIELVIKAIRLNYIQ